MRYMRSTPHGTLSAADRATSRTTTRTAILSLAALAGVTSLLAACGDDTVESPAADAAPVSAAALAGRTFISTDSAGFELVDGTTVRLVFEQTTMSASADCNSMGGSYEIDGATLRLSEGMSMTEMGCEPALMDQDTRLVGLLGASPLLTLEGDVLTVSSDTGSITFLDREVADPDRPLESTTWTLTSIISGDSVSSVPAGVTATLSISDGNVLVAAGCNTGSASVTVGDAAENGDATLTFGPLATTKMACGAEATAVETAVTTVLTGTVTFDIEADVLTIMSADGSAGLQYSVVAG